jgi:predicted porin
VKKKLMAVAVAGALAAPALALAQGTSTVNIYGQLRVDVVRADQGTGANPARVKKLWMMNRYDSGIGFRGEAKLGGNLSAWFQCENTLDVPGEDQNGDGPTGLCDRNSGLGLMGPWGNFFVGNWDTPFKLNHGSKYRPLSTASIWGSRGILFNENADPGDDETNPFQFTRRSMNSVNYHSPSWGGFNVKGQITTQDTSTNNVGSQVGTPQQAGPFKPYLWSVGAEYDNGPFSIALGYERHKDFNPGGIVVGTGAGQYAGGDDWAWEIAAAYTFAGVFRVSGIYSEVRYDVSNSTSMKHKGSALYADWAIAGPHRLRAVWAHAWDTKGNTLQNIGGWAAPTTIVNGVQVGQSSTGGDLYGIQYGYALSKRTEAYLGYARLNNDSNSLLRLQGGQARPGGNDRDQDAFAVGLFHRF